MKVVIAAGGTAGHLYPAFSTVQALRELLKADQSSLDARVFGPDTRGEKALTEKAGLSFENILAAPLRGRRPLKLILNIFFILIGTIQAFYRLLFFRPDVILSTGGYGSIPACIAGRLLQLPLVIFLPDIEPGLAVRFESKIATHIATSTKNVNTSLSKKKLSVTGYPVRNRFNELTTDSARIKLGLKDNETVLFVSGASQGSQLLNNFVFQELEDLCQSAVILHITGENDIEEALEKRADLPADLVNRYRPESFFEDIPIFMFSANLSIMRAGASILGELPAAKLPAILIPGDYAGGHQKANAHWLANQGAAVIIEENELVQLKQKTLEILANETRLKKMKTAMHNIGEIAAAKNLAHLLLEAKR